MIVTEWLKVLSNTNESSEEDDKRMQNLCIKIGFPNAIATCGIVYFEGKGEPMDIHTVAKAILSF